MTLLWTIASLEQVFSGYQQTGTPLREIRRKGVTMLVREINDTPGMGEIERIISPNPRDYLRIDFQPGTVIGLYGEAQDGPQSV